mmetsp:Transcript_55234/g.148988  ORF Transcript_55234/g.148988 Transcript_55234/m.148988 type:complete len:210 (+) Transcript_55234:615-1244(+)
MSTTTSSTTSPVSRTISSSESPLLTWNLAEPQLSGMLSKSSLSSSIASSRPTKEPEAALDCNGFLLVPLTMVRRRERQLGIELTDASCSSVSSLRRATSSIVFKSDTSFSRACSFSSIFIRSSVSSLNIARFSTCALFKSTLTFSSHLAAIWLGSIWTFKLEISFACVSCMLARHLTTTSFFSFAFSSCCSDVKSCCFMTTISWFKRLF